MRPVPKHFYLMFGQLPSAISDRAMLALKDGNEDAFEAEMANQLTPQERFNGIMFTREAVKYACIKPKIVFDPKTEDEVSPLDISEKAFAFLSTTVMRVLGGQKVESLNAFRGQPKQSAGNLVDGKKLRKSSKRAR